jgi:predicted phosphodiesterase
MIGQTEIRQIKETISEREENFTCVFLHHNVIPIPHIRERGLLEDSGDFLRELCDINVDLVLTGHSSHPYAVKIENTLICNANTISGLHHRNPFGNSFNVIDIYEKLIYISEIHSLWGSRRILGTWKRQEKV